MKLTETAVNSENKIISAGSPMNPDVYHALAEWKMNKIRCCNIKKPGERTKKTPP